MRATALGLLADDFPGWLRISLTDAAGRVHHVVEKVPVLTEVHVDAATPFPFELWLHAEHERMDDASVLVRLAHGVTTTAGLAELALSPEDVRWL